MPVKKILTWALVIFIAYYLVTQPVSAGHAIGSVLGGMKDDLAKFIGELG